MTEVSPVDPGLVDLVRLCDWMDDKGLGRGAISNVTALTGGTQNLLMRHGR